MNSEYSSILQQFPFDGSFIKLDTIDEGHINTTLKAEFSGAKYIIQKINTVVFTKPDELMSNIFAATEYIKHNLSAQGIDPSRRTLNFLKTNDGKMYYRDDDGNCWRSYVYIDNCYTLSENCSAEEIFEAARAFGEFQNMLSGFDGSKLYESIENFHNTPVRFKAFLEAVEKDPVGRVKDVAEEIEFFKARENETGIVTGLLARGGLPVRVTHNDTKINNILFDKDTKKAICIIDLDTIMPGSSLYDFGDSVRSGAGTAKEDEVDFEKMTLNLDIYTAYVNGYLEGTAGSLTDKEIELLPFSSKLLTYETGIRFLTDYINGDVYFRTTHPTHNLERAHTQMQLVKDIENKFEQMKEITASAAGRIKSES